MCGRFTLTLVKEAIEKQLGEKLFSEYKPRYNIAPGQEILALTNEGIAEFKWGLVPSWAKDEKTSYKMINARYETLGEKASYKNLLKTNRCAILADGYYEWKGTKGNKTPYWIHSKELIMFAGLWTQKDELQTCTIITLEPTTELKEIHDRMPALLTAKTVKNWLEGDSDLVELAHEVSVSFYPVGKAVNYAQNDDPSLLNQVS